MPTDNVPTATEINFRRFAPEWATLSDTITELCNRETTLAAEAHRISQRRWLFVEDAGRATTPDVSYPPKPPVPLSAAARELLGSLAPPKPEKEPEQGPRKPIVEYRDSLTQRGVAITREIDTIREAVAALRPRHEAAHAEASKRRCTELLPEYRQAAGDVCAALVALGDAILRHRSLLRREVQQGVDTMYLRPLGLEALQPELGDPGNRESRLRRFLSWGIESGHVPSTVVPEEWDQGLPGTAGAHAAQRTRKGILSRLADAANPSRDDTGDAGEVS